MNVAFRNPISICLYGIGLLLILIAFVAGIVFSIDENSEIHMTIMLYWWLSGLVSGFAFIGMSEMVHLLQKIHDQRGSAHPSSGSSQFPMPVGGYRTAASEWSGNEEREEAADDSEVKFRDLTIQLDDEKLKGEFWITNEELSIMKRSLFQEDFQAQVVRRIKKSSLSDTFEKSKDYLIYSFTEGNNRHRLAFKTHHIFDYERIVALLKED